MASRSPETARPGFLPALAIAVVLGAVYGLTLLPGAGHSPDTAEMQFCTHTLSVTHPTGYPVYLLTAHAFSRVVAVGTPAFRANLFSAVCSVLACLVLRRLLRRLGAREAAASSVALAFGLTPTFWRASVVAEVYSLHILFLGLVADSLIRWKEAGTRRALLVACGVLVASFGNHLTTVTLLPAFAFLVLATRPRVLVEPRVVLPVAALVALGLLAYAYPLVRAQDPSTPYVAVPIGNLSELVAYATGAMFHGSMFSFTPAQALLERPLLFLRLLWADCGVLLPFAALGIGALKDRRVAGFLALALLGHLAFALNYDIPDIDVYFVAAYFLIAVVAGVGLERLLASRAARRLPAAACLALPLGLAALHWEAVLAARGAGKAEPMRELLAEVRGGALVVGRYNDLMYLLSLTLAENRASPGVFLAAEVPVEEVVAYVRDRRPLYLRPLRTWAPAGLPVYSTHIPQRAALRAAGLTVTMVQPGVFRVDPATAQPQSPAAGPS